MNVVVLVLESVAERWTSFGGIYDTTPNLVKEAARGLVVDHFYAHVGRSSNSLAALLLSVYPKLNFRDFTEEYPRVERTSLATLFHERGYRTAFMTPSDMGWAGWGTFLPARGFDEVRDQHALACSPPISSWGVEDRCLADGLIEFIERDPARPFFVMGWTQQTHHPYEPSPDTPVIDLVGDREPSPDAYDLNRYLNVLRETDRQLARVFDALRQNGLADNTIVAVVGDHGQAFGYPHDSYLQGRTVYQEDVQVPLLIWWPRRYASPQRAPIIGGHIDLAPTIAELAGIPPAPDWQGRSLFDSERAPRAYFYVAQDEFKLAVREGGWKYILDLRRGTDELYDLDHDPAEQHNLAADQQARCTRLRQRLAAWAEANRRQYDRAVRDGAASRKGPRYTDADDTAVDVSRAFPRLRSSRCDPSCRARERLGAEAQARDSVTERGPQPALDRVEVSRSQRPASFPAVTNMPWSAPGKTTIENARCPASFSV